MSRESAIALMQSQQAPAQEAPTRTISIAPNMADKAPVSPEKPMEVGKAAEAPKEAPEAPSVDNRRILDLERKERAIRAESKRLQALKAEIEAAKAPKPKSEAELRTELREQFLKDPTSFGLSYEDISQRYLSQPSPEQQAMQSIRQQLEAEKAEREKLAKTFEETQTKAYQQAVKQISNQVAQLVANNDAYEAVRVDGAQGAVVQLIEDVYRSEGTVLDVEEAASAIEEVIVERAKAYSKLKKLQAAAPASTEAAPKQTQPAPQKTLTNAMVQSSKSLSAKERRERAIAAFRGQLT